jgi:hypothetical protein
VVREIAHKMIGNGVPYGFPRITELGRKVTDAASIRDAAAAARYVDELSAVVEDELRLWPSASPSGTRPRTTPGYHAFVATVAKGRSRS